MNCDLTIAIPVYERYDFFEEAINSALSQTMSCKIIVVDNASSHNKFREHVKNLQNENVKYYRNEKNLGMVGNWNQCIKLCDTPWLSILHDDDCLHPEFIASFQKIREYKSDIDGFVCSVEFGEAPHFNKNGKCIKFKLQRQIKKNFLFGNITPFPGVAFKIQSGIFFDESMYPISDMDFWYRNICKFKFYKSPMKLAFYRISKKQTSNNLYSDIVNKTELFMDKYIISHWNPIDKLISEYTLNKLRLSYEETYKNEKVYKIKQNILFTVLRSSYIRLLNIYCSWKA